MTDPRSSLRAEDDLDRERPADRLWAEVYWISQFFSLAGFVIGYLWIVGAYADARGDSGDFDPTAGWNLGVVPVMIATGLMTVSLVVLGAKASGWAGALGALVLQGVLALVLYVAVIATPPFVM